MWINFNEKEAGKEVIGEWFMHSAISTTTEKRHRRKAHQEPAKLSLHSTDWSPLTAKRCDLGWWKGCFFGAEPELDLGV
jgi:hypothetical protein